MGKNSDKLICIMMITIIIVCITISIVEIIK